MTSKAASSAYRRYVDARCLPTLDGAYAADALQAMQTAILDALRGDGPLPGEMRLHLALAFEYLCAGVSFDLLTPITRPGGREPPIAKHTQQDGIRYLRWCDDGRITDPAPASTVATAYGVSTATVGNWRRAWADRPTPPLFEDYGADQVTDFMRVSGKAYQRFKPKATPQHRVDRKPRVR